MAMSEVFNLDFKFGGNAEFLSRLEALMQRIDGRFDSFEESVKDSTEATDKMADAVDDLNSSFKDGLGAMTQFGEKLKDIAKYYLSFQAIRAGAERVWSFGMESMEAYSTQERAENQLKGVMKNRGTLADFNAIKDYAANIQGRSIYGDEAMIRGAGELATYVKGTESLKSMMDLLTDYAAGMTGGGEVSPEQMESLATGLGMAYDGNYMAMRRKGFDTSKLEALDALAENGGVWTSKMQKKYGKDWSKEESDEFKKVIDEAKKLGGISEQMRVDALKDALSDWKGLSDEVNKLDSSALVKLKNKLGDLREDIGKKLYPVFNKLVEGIDSNMPKIEAFFNSVATMFQTIANAIINNMDSLVAVTQVFTGAIEFMANWYNPLLTTVMAMKLVPPALRAMSTAATTVSTSGFAGLTKSLTALVNPAALAGVALVGLASTMWSIWQKTEDKNREKVRGIKSKEADDAIEEYKSLQKEYESADNEYQKRGIYSKMTDARSKAENAVMNYARNNEGVAKAEWAQYFRSGIQMTDYNGLKEGMVKFTEGAPAGGMKNPFDELKLELDRMLKDSKVNLHQTFNNTNIEQKVNVAAEVEKIGMLLNFSVRAAIQQAMEQNKNQMAVGEI